MTDHTTKGASRNGGLNEQRAAVRGGLDMKSAIIKRSIELNGHKTSVSLEDEFWSSLRTIAHQKNLSLPGLLQAIDVSREGANLSSAIRVYVLTHFRALAASQAAEPGRRLPPPLPPHA
jgi:predicted DNA-binding ribbon-helix-helix protein